MTQRESDTLTNLSTSVSTLRTTTTSQSATIAKLESQNETLQRQLALITGQERSARATLRSAETRNRVLREEMTRLKGSVAQVRAQCAADVRRRDGEIARLKKHLEGRRGKDGVSAGIGVVVVTPGAAGRSQGMGGVADDEGSGDSLKQETTEFLTRLSQGLSDENDALIGLVRGTLATLRSLQGLPELCGAAGSEGEPSPEDNVVGGFLNGPPSVEALALSTDEVLEHLRGLLTNPSFVPLEEVEIREEEIQRLREGWEKMALRWKEAMSLMDGWKKRVVDTGDTIKLDDLRDGLKLGNGIPSAIEARVSPGRKGMCSANDDSSMLQELREQQGDVLDEVTNLSEPLEEVEMALPVSGRALANRSPNARPAQAAQKASFPSIIEEEKNHITNTEDGLSLLDFSKDKPLNEDRAKEAGPRVPVHVSLRGFCFREWSLTFRVGSAKVS